MSTPSLFELITGIRKYSKPRQDCEECGAGVMELCREGCSQWQKRMRGTNAPHCEDGLHHHCALLPHCRRGECVNKRKAWKAAP